MRKRTVADHSFRAMSPEETSAARERTSVRSETA
jgi:hypothetical protein